MGPILLLFAVSDLPNKSQLKLPALHRRVNLGRFTLKIPCVTGCFVRFVVKSSVSEVKRRGSCKCWTLNAFEAGAFTRGCSVIALTRSRPTKKSASSRPTFILRLVFVVFEPGELVAGALDRLTGAAGSEQVLPQPVGHVAVQGIALFPIIRLKT